MTKWAEIVFLGSSEIENKLFKGIPMASYCVLYHY